LNGEQFTLVLHDSAPRRRLVGIPGSPRAVTILPDGKL